MILFLSRRFPPSTGGMETHAKAVDEALRSRQSVHSITLGRHAYAHLCWFLPVVALRGLLVLSRRVTAVVAADALVLAALRPVLMLRPSLPVVAYVYGLDMTFKNRLYQALLRWSLRRADTVIAISQATAKIAVDQIGLDPAKVVVIPAATGLEPVAGGAGTRQQLVDQLGLAPDQPILLTLGRLVPRKGVAWFVEAGLPLLDERIAYLVAGEGSDEPTIRAAAERAGRSTQVHLLGRVDDGLRALLLANADVFVMPNVPVPDDVEGFGLVAVEAALHGTIVVAAALEGINDAVVDGVTGYLCRPGDAAGFVAKITAVLTDPARSATAASFRVAAIERFGHDAFADHLWATLDATVEQRRLR